MWRSSETVEQDLGQLSNLDQLQNLFHLSGFWKNLIYGNDYSADDEWTRLLVASSSGKDLISRLGKVRDNTPAPEFFLALFAVFSYHEIIFDWEASDIQGILAVLEKELLSKRVRLPYLFGRRLYDRFNDFHDATRTDHLLSAHAEKLLEDSPNGVYQLGTYVSGPLGILDAREHRRIPPTRRLPLWHCSDTGCSAVHEVALLPPNIPLVKAYEEITHSLHDELGPPSEWDFGLVRLHRRGQYQKGRPFYDLPVALGNALIDSERTALLSALLESTHGEHLREMIGRPPRRPEDARGASEEIAGKLSPEETLQLLFLLPDTALVDHLDRLINEKRIRILLGETRQIRTSPPRFSQRDSATQISSFGVRSARKDPIVSMCAAILRCYQKQKVVNELEWRVESDTSEPIDQALFQFVQERGPQNAIKQLVLSSRAISQELCTEFRFPFPNTAFTDDTIVDRLLWKMGFNPVQFDESISRFRARLKDFSDCVLETSPIETEADRELIRSVGVNLFVSVEEFIEGLLAYNVWLLSSDHFVEGKFQFDLMAARGAVSKVLGSRLTTGHSEWKWSSEGENSLGVLLGYLSASATWMKALEEKNRGTLLRPLEDLPHFAEDQDRQFPFLHTELWADAETTQLTRYRDGYLAIVKMLQQAELAPVRNGLDHHRQKNRFPEADKMLTCVEHLQQGLDLADVNRYLPKVFWLYTSRRDRFGSVEFECLDYAQRKFTVLGPSQVSGLPPILYSQPLIVAPGNLLGRANATLVFRLRETSGYSKYWEGYPRRRVITPQ